MLFASIDIGTNAMRLLFSDVHIRDGIAIAEKASLIRIPIRLGDDVFKLNRISDTKTEELLQTMLAFKLLIDVFKPVTSQACATAAMREADNRDAVVEKIRNKTGIEVKIISGLEEAEIISLAETLDVKKYHRYKMYVDVGGGSTEISLLEDHKIIESRSFKIGTIRYLNDKVDESEWKSMKQWLKGFKSDFDKLYLIGSGGNINKLAKLYGKKVVNTICFKEIEDAFHHLNQYSVEERIDKLGLRRDRADVIVPAAKIFIKIMKLVKADFVYVPKIGLADGLIYKMYYEYVKTHTI